MLLWVCGTPVAPRVRLKFGLLSVKPVPSCFVSAPDRCIWLVSLGPVVSVHSISRFLKLSFLFSKIPTHLLTCRDILGSSRQNKRVCFEVLLPYLMLNLGKPGRKIRMIKSRKAVHPHRPGFSSFSSLPQSVCFCLLVSLEFLVVISGDEIDSSDFFHLAGTHTHQQFILFTI